MLGSCVVLLIAVGGCWLSGQAAVVRRERRSSSAAIASNPVISATATGRKGKTASNPNFVGMAGRHVIMTQLGGTFQLRCEASGTPISAISWLLNGRPIAGISGAIGVVSNDATAIDYEARSSFPANGLEREANGKLKTILWGSTASLLTVPCVTESDLGVYTCVAENSERKNSMNFTVKSAPDEDMNDVSCVEDRPDVPKSAAASVVTWTRDRIERHDAVVQLQCQGSGSFSGKPVRWFRSYPQDDGDVLRNPIVSDAVTYEVLPTGDLMVKQADLCTGGCLFTCQIGSRRYDSFMMATVGSLTNNRQGMAHQYELIYFDCRGRGEAIRYIFAYAQTQPAETRISFADWPTVKPTVPYGQLPVLKVVDKNLVLSQHLAIARYLAKQFGIAGKDATEQAKADQYVDGTADLFKPFAPVIGAVLGRKSKEEIGQAYAAFKAEALQPYLDRYEGFLKANGGELFVGNEVTWADLYIAEMLERFLRFYDPQLLAGHPNLKGLVERVHAIPAIAKYVAGRPESKVPI